MPLLNTAGRIYHGATLASRVYVGATRVWSADAVAVAVGESGSIFYTRDGAIWTSATSGTAAHLRGVTWSPGLKQFLAVGSSSMTFTSTDGIRWSAVGGTGTIVMRAIAWSPSLGLFVRVGDSGHIATSPTGVTWTTRTNPLGSSVTMTSVTWGADIGMFVAATTTGGLVTSTNGTTWTFRTSGFAATASINGVARARGQFLAVGAGGVSSQSTDGVTWTANSAWTGGADINAVTANPAGDGWYAVGTGRTGTKLGGAWSTTTGSGITGNTFRGVAWSAALGLYIAVGDAGVLNTRTPSGPMIVRNVGLVNILAVAAAA